MTTSHVVRAIATGLLVLVIGFSASILLIVVGGRMVASMDANAFYPVLITSIATLVVGLIGWWIRPGLRRNPLLVALLGISGFVVAAQLAFLAIVVFVLSASPA